MSDFSGPVLRALLNDEFALRRQDNPRYSLRTFARTIGTDHGTLSRLMRGRRTPSQVTIDKIRHRLQPGRDAVVLRRLLISKTVVSSIDSARMLGISVDRVNVALQRLIVGRELRLEGERWRVQQ
jgi:transcriptional regulator with XRE-family HTH domain